MGICVIGKLSQLFITSAYSQFKFKKKLWRNPILLIGPLYTPHSICLDIGC